MMRLIGFMTKQRLKRFWSILLAVLVPLAFMIIMNFFEGGDEIDESLAVVLEEASSKDYLESFFPPAAAKIEDRKEAEEKLKKGEINAILFLPKDLKDKIEAGVMPQIRVLSFVANALPGEIQVGLRSRITNRVLQVRLAPEGIDLPDLEIPESKSTDDPMKTMIAYTMILYMTSIGTSAFATQLLGLRDSGTLERLLMSRTGSYQILLSVFIPEVVVTTISNLFVVIVLKYAIGMEITDLLAVVIFSILSNIVNLSIGVFSVRYFGSEKVVSLPATLFSMFEFFGYMMYNMSPVKSPFAPIQVINYFNPYYWSIEGMMNGQYFPNALMLLLIAALFFSMGGLALRNIVKPQH